jgi:hypothetical protein
MMGWSVTIMTLIFEVSTSIAAARLRPVSRLAPQVSCKPWAQ